MTKITPEHLARDAVVYVRQSTSDQVPNNHESRRRQYGLADRSRALGWATVEVDRRRSRPLRLRCGPPRLREVACRHLRGPGRCRGVDRGLAARSQRARLAHAAEFCGLVGTLIVDEDGVYDPRHPNDRLLLGMKGTMSEMELSLFRQRSLEASAEGASWRTVPHGGDRLLEECP